MNKELDKTFQYFLDNLKELDKLYRGKFVVLKDCKIIGVYDTYENALTDALKTNEVGSFLIQEVNADPSSYTLYLNDFAVVI